MPVWLKGPYIQDASMTTMSAMRATSSLAEMVGRELIVLPITNGRKVQAAAHRTLQEYIVEIITRQVG